MGANDGVGPPTACLQPVRRVLGLIGSLGLAQLPRSRYLLLALALPARSLLTPRPLSRPEVRSGASRCAATAAVQCFANPVCGAIARQGRPAPAYPRAGRLSCSVPARQRASQCGLYKPPAACPRRPSRQRHVNARKRLQTVGEIITKLPALQRQRRSDPQRLELHTLMGQRRWALRLAGNEKRQLKTAQQFGAQWPSSLVPVGATASGLWHRRLGRCTALLFAANSGAAGCKKCLAEHPEPLQHRRCRQRFVNHLARLQARRCGRFAARIIWLCRLN